MNWSFKDEAQYALKFVKAWMDLDPDLFAETPGGVYVSQNEDGKVLGTAKLANPGDEVIAFTTFALNKCTAVLQCPDAISSFQIRAENADSPIYGGVISSIDGQTAHGPSGFEEHVDEAVACATSRNFGIIDLTEQEKVFAISGNPHAAVIEEVMQSLQVAA
ncbi:MAG: hypothetical protein ACI9H6_000464 [Patiriisocius sp.]|jgi:hypothetical protein